MPNIADMAEWHRKAKLAVEIERLARDICWAEFATKPKGITKAAYWRDVDAYQKESYVRDAEWLVFIAKALKPLRILSLVDFKIAGRSSRRGSGTRPSRWVRSVIA